LIELARGADVLVHEAMYSPVLEATAQRLPHARRLLEHLRASHTSAEDAGRVAARAGVRTLVLSHLIPPDDPAVTDELWRAAAAAHFSGEVIVGRDLLEVPAGAERRHTPCDPTTIQSRLAADRDSQHFCGPGADLDDP
jgi:ribonuclease BN (tRNA processing enzyme)